MIDTKTIFSLCFFR